MMEIDVEKTTKGVGLVTAIFAMVGGGYAVTDKVGFFKKPILEWAPEHFSISDGPANGSFRVVVARKKYRDCDVTKFALEVKDSNYVVHKAKPSIPSFSGPATKEIDKFAYSIKIENPQNVAKGEAMLLAHIGYKCPEGEQVVNYPSHPNLTFNVE